MTPENGSTGRTVTRRGFLTAAAAVGGGLLIGVDAVLPAARAVAASSGPMQVTLYVRVASDNTVTMLHPASEMGQGTMTSLVQLVAEELRLDWSAVRVEQALNDTRLGNHALGGRQMTAGSRSIRGYYAPLRLAGAEARERLVAAAAARWAVQASECVPDRGVVTGPGGRRATYGELAQEAATVSYTRTPTVVSDNELRLIGQPVARLDLRAKCNGSAIFGVDVRLPDMLYAGIQQAPKVNQTATTWATPPRGMKAVPVPGGVAVIGGTTTWHAIRAARDLAVSWTDGPGTAGSDSATLRAQAAQLLAGSGPSHVIESGSGAQAAVRGAPRRLSATYDVPFLAHHTLEPMNATALVRLDAAGEVTTVEVWAPTQAQTDAANVAAKSAGVPASAVTVHTTFLGGGMGRRATNDYVAQAVAAAKAVPGRPVKLVWSREEDFTHDIYRPMATARLEAGIDADGNITGLLSRLVSTSIRKTSPQPDTTDPGYDGFAFEGLEKLPYQVPQRVEWVRQPTYVPLGTWRSVGFSHNTFFVESFLDELAIATKQDPFALRAALLAGRPRHLRVLEVLRQKSGWDTPAPSGRARGMAFVEGFGSLVGQVLEVSGSIGSPKVHRVTVVYDCGRVVNPDTVAAQMQGACIQGLAAAISGGMPFASGAPTKRNFTTYKLPRLADTPAVIDVHAADPASAEPPGGAGEPGLPCAAPALTNALTALTGIRARSLPLA